MGQLFRTEILRVNPVQGTVTGFQLVIRGDLPDPLFSAGGIDPFRMVFPVIRGMVAGAVPAHSVAGLSVRADAHLLDIAEDLCPSAQILPGIFPGLTGLFHSAVRPQGEHARIRGSHGLHFTPEGVSGVNELRPHPACMLFFRSVLIHARFGVDLIPLFPCPVHPYVTDPYAGTLRQAVHNGAAHDPSQRHIPGIYKAETQRFRQGRRSNRQDENQEYQ